MWQAGARRTFSQNVLLFRRKIDVQNFWISAPPATSAKGREQKFKLRHYRSDGEPAIARAYFVAGKPPSPVFRNCLRRAMNVAYVRLRLSAPNCSTLALGREMDHMVGRESGEGVGEHAPVAHVDLGEGVSGQRLKIARVSERVDVEPDDQMPDCESRLTPRRSPARSVASTLPSVPLHPV